MSFKDELKARLLARVGNDVSKAIDELYRTGALDDSLARKYVAIDKFVITYGATDESPKQVMYKVAEEVGIDRTTLLRAVRNSHP